MAEKNLLLKWEAILGEPLLRFVLNQDDGALENLTEDQRMVLHDLDSGGVIGQGDDPRMPVALAAVCVGGPSRAWKLRKRCGGEILEPQGKDQVARALTLIARDSYPVLLSRPDLTVEAVPGLNLPASDPSIGLSQLVRAHPAHVEAQQELAAEAEEWKRVVVESISSRDWLSGAPTPDGVIGAGAGRWQHRPEGGPSDFLEAVLETLTALRRLGIGEAVEAFAVIGLRGLNLEADLELQLPVGLLRAPTDHESRFAPFFQQPAEVDAVLVVPTKLTAKEPGSDGPTQLTMNQEIVDIAQSVSLASALARRDVVDYLAAIAVSWITEWTPLPGSGAFKPGPFEGLVLKVDYGSAELAALGEWIERLRASHSDRIRIAMDRILRAIFEMEAAESLIDAVIAWENLVGSRTETVYKVTASLAVLCEDDPGERIRFRKELAGLYDKRSRLVHGDESWADFGIRNRAIQVGLEAIARLIEKRPELLALTKSSSRADRLLMGIDS